MDTSSHTNPDKRTYQETMPYIKRTISHNESDNPTQEISKEYTSIKHPTLLQDLYGISDPAVRCPNILSLLAATGLAIPISLSWSFAKPTGKRVRIGGSMGFRSLLPACGRCGHIFTARAMSVWNLCILVFRVSNLNALVMGALVLRTGCSFSTIAGLFRTTRRFCLRIVHDDTKQRY